MNIITSLFRHIQAARALIAKIAKAATYTTPARVPVAPYMESLPTRRPTPRRLQVRRISGFTQLGIDG